jgi:hypothetical protein
MYPAWAAGDRVVRFPLDGMAGAAGEKLKVPPWAGTSAAKPRASRGTVFCRAADFTSSTASIPPHDPRWVPVQPVPILLPAQ